MGVMTATFRSQLWRAARRTQMRPKPYLIEAESIATPHGKLGCLACHGGEGQASDKASAHQDLVADMSAQDPEKCVICHEELPSEFPNDRLRLPHGEIIRRIQSGEPCDVHCSDCHGGCRPRF